jgi:hypothetical protein
MTIGNIIKAASVAAVIAGVALAAQPALAFGGHGHGGGGWHGGHGGWGGGGWGWGGPYVGLGYGVPYYYDDYEYGGDCTYRRVRVRTAYGVRWRTVRYCD